MRTFAITIVLSAGILATSASAEIMLKVDGKDYPLSTLMDHCQSMAQDQSKQIACFQAVSTLVEEQTATPPTVTTTAVPEALEALRALASFQDAETGLIVEGSGCNIEITYFGNYFHISRRNVSSLDLFSARFDASDFVYEQTNMKSDGQFPYATGTMEPGTVARSFADLQVESARYDFAPKDAALSVRDYAIEVADQVAHNESTSFDFVLVHPAKQHSSTEIWRAFETYVAACQS